MGDTGCDHIVFGCVLLELESHCFDMAFSMIPVSFCLEVSKANLIFYPQFYFSGTGGDFPGYKLTVSSQGFMIKQDTGKSKPAITFPVISCQFEPCHF
jgi:hypothetical protein